MEAIAQSPLMTWEDWVQEEGRMNMRGTPLLEGIPSHDLSSLPLEGCNVSDISYGLRRVPNNMTLM